MAKNGKGKKNDAPDPKAPETQPKADTPIAVPEQTIPQTNPKPETEIQAEFIGTVQPKYKTDEDTIERDIVQKIEEGATNEAKTVYKLARQHKIVMAGLASALAVSIIIAVVLSANLQAVSGRAATLSSSYNSLSAQNSQLSSRLANLSDYNTNFSRLRDQLVSLQSALSNRNITVQNLHYTITSMSQQLSNVTNQINAQNSTIFSLQVQLTNLTKHLGFGYAQTLVQPVNGNLYIQPGSSYEISFVTNYSGILSLNITSNNQYKVSLVGPYGTYLSQSYNSGSTNIGLPVVGTPKANLKYTIIVSNPGSQYLYGSIGAYLFN